MTQFDKVREFQKAFNCPAPDQPTLLSEDQVLNRTSWIGEEIVEILFEHSNNDAEFERFYDYLMDKMFDTFMRQKTEKTRSKNKLMGICDGFIDILYFANGGMVEAGVDPNPLFDIVHKANMAKLWEDGKPKYNDVGKVIKPPHWVAPDGVLEQEIERQIKAAAQ
ncbi:hypothetical protein [Paenibacillus sp. NAIST15-1]|uniref:hypothetical protein n=1 Tax=Paenibacillus sp. NAIST15-1 TaxID=1605994 RepID=UPI0009329EA6|nr:hypothetical protein [Paenibacillus sp. NAIST15-1]